MWGGLTEGAELPVAHFRPWRRGGRCGSAAPLGPARPGPARFGWLGPAPPPSPSPMQRRDDPAARMGRGPGPGGGGGGARQGSAPPRRPPRGGGGRGAGSGAQPPPPLLPPSAAGTASAAQGPAAAASTTTAAASSSSSSSSSGAGAPTPLLPGSGGKLEPENKYLPELMAEKDSLDPSFTHAMQLLTAGTGPAGTPGNERGAGGGRPGRSRGGGVGGGGGAVVQPPRGMGWSSPVLRGSPRFTGVGRAPGAGGGGWGGFGARRGRPFASTRGERGPRRMGTAGICTEPLPEALRGASPLIFPSGAVG